MKKLHYLIKPSRLPRKRALIAIAIGAVVCCTFSSRADEVTDWNRNMLQAALVAKTSPMVTSRVAAMVHTAVFDALNGIERRYQPIHVPAAAPRGASRRAAVIEAAYTVLVNLFPTQKATFDAELATSLAGIVDDPQDIEDSVSIARGITWGQTVANAILAWRSTDGFTPAPPPFLGGGAVGQWRPTPPAFASGAVPQFAYMTPWALLSSGQFLPDPQPPLTSAQYTTDFDEIKSMGSISSITRSADQTLLSQFWNASTVSYFWNTVAVSLSTQNGYTLSQNARLLALMNVAVADGVIACWNAKYTYVAWRPITAIPLAATDGNDDTVADPLWTPLLITPPHPEYPSGHSTTSSAAAAVLSRFFGVNTSFTVDSDVMLGVTRSFSSFPAALDEIADARVFGGIHFRTACNVGRGVGQNVGNYVLDHVALRIHGIGNDAVNSVTE